ncbi:MAG: ADP-ribosylglycohydrolase family protein [Sandaracinaceae bacterium]
MDDRRRRRDLGRRVAALTHTDPRAIQGALYVAELSAACIGAESPSTSARESAVTAATPVLRHPDLQAAVTRARGLHEGGVELVAAAEELGTSGFVVHTVGLCTFVFLRFGAGPGPCLLAAIEAGGDTDTHAAIVGGWMGALHGASLLPSTAKLQSGPFGVAHLTGLADALLSGEPPPAWSWSWALVRNLALYPVVLGHGLSRLAFWY